ncbi:MAG TPA: hypothetical protein VGR73_03840 [Bryobacteraceae bacterium]|nr:hypothetical protein [Bryobacteraceae bacterium]
MNICWSRFILAALTTFLLTRVALSSRAQEPGNRPARPPAGNPAVASQTAVHQGTTETGPNPGISTAAVDQLLDRIVEREHQLLESLGPRTPQIETYIQETPGGERPTRDHYFLGRFRLAGAVGYEPLLAHTDPPSAKPASRFPLRPAPARPAASPLTFLPRGFAQMAAIDLREFNREVYRFEYVRREFLGEVRCLVFDVTPVNRRQPGKFIGRLWVEDRDYAIVRFNGTYIPSPTPKGAQPELYFHFDSWRVNVGGALWAPAQIYIEEEGSQASGLGTRFKAQSRIWDYAAKPGAKLAELTSILVDGAVGAGGRDAAPDVSPLESQRSWERQAEENLIARLEKGGLLAPRGPVDQVLDTVANNLIVSAKLAVEVHCRVLLTTPLESFAIGHTIVVSRGLIDVLPDEASLALVVADQLSHIALGHRTETQYAFTSQTMLSDPEVLERLRFERTPEEMLEAGKKTVEIVRASPYRNTANAGLFLQALAAHTAVLPHLLQANLGNQIADARALARLAEFAVAAPTLDENQLEQIAALPLGSRVRLNPWDNHIELIQARPLALLSPREKMPFEVTPFVLYLIRAETTAAGQGDELVKK